MLTRDRILDAAGKVMREQGLARATTKQIAAAAGFSEATLYKHFSSKTELFVAVLNERVPGEFGMLLAQLAGRAGTGDVAATLRGVAHGAIDFYTYSFPMAASLFSEPQLLAAHRDALRQRGAGPQNVPLAVAAYLAAERDRGRIRPDADPEAAASLLIGACLQYAFLGHFTEPRDPGSAERYVTTIVANLVSGIAGPVEDR
ncbi:TetR/AcrR family transcriptional regulator [Micromonospora polyrhachis]|uniref:AcrR family transcriptional regulator n=1 Tax=Micromonospora polyrhachis TaxID=1282883 RepID=A0A7W7WNE0_9ACTN|nr:TetR/AcrR family transcriptional regulator [Micromonospora polyrhachis]MBB4957512.1 AcrR family transcriptional regulator [Micromonospora polyrhachis]